MHEIYNALSVLPPRKGVDRIDYSLRAAKMCLQPRYSMRSLGIGGCVCLPERILYPLEPERLDSSDDLASDQC